MPGPHAGPPQVLDQPLELPVADWKTHDVYQLLTALVVPRPIGWISTVSASGVRNLAPYSYFNLMGSDPFYVAFGSSGVKDTLANIRETGQFVANIVTMDLMEKMNFTATDFPGEEDEFGWGGLTPVPSVKVSVPRVGEAKAHLECELVQVISDRDAHIVLGRIEHVHVAPSVWKDGRVDPRLLDPVCRLSGSLYGRLGDIFSVQRPKWKNVQGTNGQEAMPLAVKR